MSDVAGVMYTFCVIESTGVHARGGAVRLVSKLLLAGFTLAHSEHSMQLIPFPQPPPSAHAIQTPPREQKTAVYTLVRQPLAGKNQSYDQAVIDSYIKEICDNEGGIVVQIA